MYGYVYGYGGKRGSSSEISSLSDIWSTNLLLHLEARLETGYGDNDPVETPIDQSGSNNEPTQAILANRPVFKGNVLNFQPTFRFDNDFWEFTVPPFFASHQVGTVFALIRRDLNALFDLLVHTNRFSSNALAGHFFSNLSYYNYTLASYVYLLDQLYADATTDDEQFHLVMITSDGATLSFYVDTGLVATLKTIANTPNTGAWFGDYPISAGARPTIGARFLNGGTTYSQGDIAFMGYADRHSDASDFDKLKSYATSIYNFLYIGLVSVGTFFQNFHFFDNNTQFIF